MYGYIYKTTNLVNGKIYIGQKKSKKFLGNKYLGSGKRLWEAIYKYGRDKFQVTLLEEVNEQEQLDDREIYWISKFNSTDKNIGYNLALGGRVRRDLVGEHNGFYNKKHSTETREKLSSYRKNKIVITKDDCIKYIDSSEMMSYLSLGWKVKKKPVLKLTNEEQSRIRTEKLKGRVVINNGREIKRVKEEELSDYLSNDWVKGLPQSSIEKIKKTKKEYFDKVGRPSKVRYIRIKNTSTDEIISIDFNKLNEYLKMGWIRYYHPMSAETKEKLVQKNIGRVKTEEEKQKRLETLKLHGGYHMNEETKRKIVQTKRETNKFGKSKGYIHITNDIEDKMIPLNKFEAYQSLGWRRGRKKFTEKACKNIALGHKGKQAHNKNKIWINNGIINKTIDIKELNTYRSLGWSKGMIKRN